MGNDLPVRQLPLQQVLATTAGTSRTAGQQQVLRLLVLDGLKKPTSRKDTDWAYEAISHLSQVRGGRDHPTVLFPTGDGAIAFRPYKVVLDYE